MTGACQEIRRSLISEAEIKSPLSVLERCSKETFDCMQMKGRGGMGKFKN